MSDSKPLSNDKVAAWLRDNPDFFIQREDLLELIRLPDPRGEAVSLLERQAQILRERNKELRERLNGLLDVARENDELFEKTRTLSLSLIEARNSTQLCENLVRSLKVDFGSDAIALLVYDRDLQLTGEVRGHVRCLPAGQLPEALQLLLRNGKAVCGVLRPGELEHLFPEQKEQVKSAAMVPLEFQGRQGVLAIGSYDAQHFRSSLGTLFISHIGAVLARRLADLGRGHPEIREKRA